MAKKSPLPQSKRHIMVYDEDWEFLIDQYGPGSLNYKVGVSGAIKTIIHAYVRELKRRSRKAFEEIEGGQGPEAEGPEGWDR